ncbi:MAG: hypothetical protein N4A64_05105 [Marinisporobacter sp.]|nr:hypothetical protein [Marinisporobacter sp.]
MAYTGIDLIKKAIIIAKKRCEVYKNISKAMEKNLKVRIVANILVRNVKKNIEHYEKLKIQLENDDETIDFDTYDKISSLFNKFSRRFENPDIRNMEDVLEFSLSFERQVVALYVDIQGRLVKNAEDTEKKAYKILSSIIEDKKNHIKNLQMYIKK